MRMWFFSVIFSDKPKSWNLQIKNHRLDIFFHEKGILITNCFYYKIIYVQKPSAFWTCTLALTDVTKRHRFFLLRIWSPDAPSRCATDGARWMLTGTTHLVPFTFEISVEVFLSDTLVAPTARTSPLAQRTQHWRSWRLLLPQSLFFFAETLPTDTLETQLTQ